MLPRHIAIIMDGNGRWAKKRFLPRYAGHRSGVEAMRKVIRHCRKLNIEVLTVFAFSSENWRRPTIEVNLLMDLFASALKKELIQLQKNDIRLRIIGERGAFSPKLQTQIADAEAHTAANKGMQLVVAANYGGQWDILQASKQLAAQVQQGEMRAENINAEQLAQAMNLADVPAPDLFIRTGGEKRISNFLLWQLAYTELYFTDTLWPDFDGDALQIALDDYATRQRRFGQTGEQVSQQPA